MFDTPQEFILKTESMSAPDETLRFAYCQLHLTPLTHDLAKEVSSDLASCLFMLDNRGKHNRNEYLPRKGMAQMTFQQTFKPHELVFRHHSELPVVGRISPVEICDVQVHRPKGGDYRMILGLRFKITDRAIATAFLIDRFLQPVWIQLNQLQGQLALDAEDVATFHNKAAAARQSAPQHQLSLGGNGDR